jgi:phage shock protein A
MAIRLIHRINRLVAADAHGLVESLEDRALLLKQHLREAELELQHKRARKEALGEEERRIVETSRRIEDAIANHEHDAQLALAEDRDDLARFSIRKLIPLQRELSVLSARSQELSDERTRIRDKLTSQEADFERLRARVHAQLAAPEPRAGAAIDPIEPVVADEEVEMELLRRKRVGGSQ